MHSTQTNQHQTKTAAILGAALSVTLSPLASGCATSNETRTGFLSINETAPAKARHEIYIKSTPNRVWSILTDIENWEKWNHAVTRAKLNGAFVSGTVFDWKSNGFSVSSTLRDIESERRISWTGKAFGTRAIHVWYFVPQGDGVRVITDESFEGWLARLMPRAMQKSLDDSLIATLANLKSAAEHGGAL